MAPRRASGAHRPHVPALSWDDSRLLIESVIDYAIFILDVDGYVATWNAGASAIKGYQANEIIGQHFSKFYSPEDVEAGKPDRELEIATEVGRVEDEGWRVRKDGSRFWANVVITALRDESGVLRGFGKVTRDLTARREAEENERRLLLERTSREAAEHAERRIRESEERHRTMSQRLEVVLEGVADGITAQDRSGRVVFANTAAARLFGLGSAEELMQLPAGELAARFEVLDADDRPFELEDLPSRRVFAGEAASSAVLHMRERATLRDSWVSLRATAVPSAAGAPDLAIDIWHDVTGERRQQRQAKTLADATVALSSSLVSDEMLATLAPMLVPSLADWCAIDVLERGRLRSVSVAHANPAKVATVRELRAKYPPDPGQPRGAWSVIRNGASVVLDPIPDELLVSAAQDATHLATMRNLAMKAALIAPIRARNRVLGTITLVAAETSRRFDASDVALAEELGRRTGVALENAQLYAAAQEAATNAQEASQAKDAFLATVSHELRTPLAAILGWSTLLKDRITDPAAVKPIAVIHRNAQAQVKIIDDILDVSRVITGKFQLDAKPVDLVAIARDALEVVRPSADAKKITLEIVPRVPFCPLVADPERIQQVIWNVLSNAVKFTDPGGSVQVSIDRAGSNVVLTVTDSGKGIDPEFLPFVFERFRQADSSTTRRVGGLGLGLALVRHIVELHGGSVAAASEGIGKGSTITISLPVHALISARPEVPTTSQVKAPPEGVTADLSGVRVLVVDDEEDAREMVAALLTAAGAQVETAPSAAVGFDAFGHFRPDVLVSDIGMPGEDGFSFIRRIRALSTLEGGRIPSLALTAFAREEDRTRALSAGYTTHIGKPANPAALVSAVANLSGVRARS
jgi:PAS domain S-box-containing protein